MKTVLAVFVLWSLASLGTLRAQDHGGIPHDLPTPPIQTGGEIAARAAIEVWLALLDDGQFDRSWDTAASAVQKTVPKDQWIKVLSDHRPKLGKLVSRSLKATRSSTSLPGAPAGQYVVVEYDAAFEQRKGIETVTAMIDQSGQWKVSGYFFK